MTRYPDCVVIGAGVIGCCIALQLQRAGKSVLLLDAVKAGAGASAGNAGMIGPSAVIPMIAPGFLRQLPSLISGRQRSVLVRPHAALAALRWLIQCQRVANPHQLLRSRDALHILHRHTLRDWRALLGDDAWPTLMRTGSTITQHETSSEGTVMRSLPVVLRRDVGITTRVADQHAINAMFPGLAQSECVFTAVDHSAAIYHSGKLLHTLMVQFSAAGGVYQQKHARGFHIADGAVNALICNEGRIFAQHYVLAAGAASAALLPYSSLTIPLMAERGYHIMLKRHQPLFTAQPEHGLSPCVLHDASYKRVITEMADGIRVTGFVEYTATHRAPLRNCYAQLEQHFRRRFPDYPVERIAEWYGHRPSTPDSLPYIDLHPAADNLICAFGHGHYGMSGAPATARWVNELIDKTNDPNVIESFSLRRFTSFHKEKTS